MVTYNLKNIKTKKANRLFKNGKNKNISRKTMKNKKNKNNKKNKHNKNGKAYTVKSKKQLIHRNKYNITKKKVGGNLYRLGAKIKTGFKFKKTKRTLKRLFSASRKKSKEFYNNQELHDKLRDLFNIQNNKTLIEPLINTSIKDILNYIYFSLSKLTIGNKLDEPCVSNILKYTNINEYLIQDEKLSSTFAVNYYLNKRKGKYNIKNDYLKLITLSNLNKRFGEFLDKLNTMKNASTKVILTTSIINSKIQKQNEEQNKPEIKTQISSNKNSNINKKSFRYILNKKRIDNEGHDDTIYYYSKDDKGYVGFICKKNLIKENDYDIPIKIKEFSLIINVKYNNANIGDFTKYFEENIYKNEQKIKEKLLDLFCYYTIFRVINMDQNFKKIIDNKKREKANAQQEKEENRKGYKERHKQKEKVTQKKQNNHQKYTKKYTEYEHNPEKLSTLELYQQGKKLRKEYKKGKKRNNKKQNKLPLLSHYNMDDTRESEI